ncbi:hypothetical protein ANCDUO_07528 [Ancylostoma duodenale]|uniref:Leucine Rich repeat-containing domain protein n=1 Tax=Ancylostoma duodenale TaxID=51022 RepID=A0A0C2CYS9_9BILA|nr:hypothetical protein ANCDUO_07528 [Ancylostoma duodenale]
MEEEPCSLVYRLEQKYLNDDDAYMDQDIVLTNFTGSSPCKMASKRALELVVLNNANISHLGDVSQVSGLMQHVAEADLAWNSIRWECVKSVLKHLPQLRTLNLSYNPLDGEIAVDLPSAPLLHTLILNGTNLSLTSLSSILKNTPCLQELHLSDNKLDFSDDDESVMNESVKTIHMNRCRIEDWAQVVRLMRRFPNRKTVFLCENPIKSIVHQTPVEDLSTLQSLNLGKVELIFQEFSQKKLIQIYNIIDFLDRSFNDTTLEAQVNH